jgi:hypothetical protein
MNSGINVTTFRSSIVVTFPALHRGSADIALYNIAGRQIYRQRGFTGTSLRLETRTFALGIYTFLIRANGQNYSRRVAVNGREE